MILEIKRIDDLDYVDLRPYLLAKHPGWALNDTDGPNSGRTMDDDMHRNRIDQKVRLDIVLRPISLFLLRFICQIVHEEFYSFRWDDPERGLIEGLAYKSKITGNPLAVYDDGTEIWENVTFALVEK